MLYNAAKYISDSFILYINLFLTVTALKFPKDYSDWNENMQAIKLEKNQYLHPPIDKSCECSNASSCSVLVWK